MGEKLLSVGLDVGTTTTQMILSELTVENQASSFAVPQMQITKRKVLHRSPVWFTPLLENDFVDSAGIREMVEQEYRSAGIDRQDVDTGAIIITGETSRKENARAVMTAVSEFAGDFVVATAGPDLESVLAAKGAGAVELSQRTDDTVLHMDIGGGTSNLALIREGKILRTGCLNVGGRLMKFTPEGVLSYVSPVLHKITPLRPGDTPTLAQLEAIAYTLASALEMAAGLRQPSDLLRQLQTAEVETEWIPPEQGAVISFSGGVADCITQDHPPFAFGDLGPLLGKAIRESALCRETFVLGEETIRATVIGAGSHSTQLSGSTVFYQGVTLPLKNLPVAVFTEQEQYAKDFPSLLAQRWREKDAEVVALAMPGYTAPGYGQIKELAQTLVRALPRKPLLICLEADMAKALGQSLRLLLPMQTPVLCIDNVRLQPESYLDIGMPAGPCLPVVVKTLVLSSKNG